MADPKKKKGGARGGSRSSKASGGKAGSQAGRPRGPSAVVVSADAVMVKFGHITALDTFSVNIPNGVVGLLGPNGAGKSTFIKAALGLLVPQAGAITVDGMDPQIQTGHVRDIIGYMPENDCLIDSMDAVQMVSYMGRISGMTSKDAKQRAHEVLDFAGIGEERYRLIESYSTGMKQKVKLSQAIIHDPKFLFLDEPTNGMDPKGREEMLDLIRKIGASGKTILVSSHVLHEVEQICQHVIIINRGKLVMEGPIQTLMHGEEGVISLKVKGNKPSVAKFLKYVEGDFKLLSKDDRGGLWSIRLQGGSSLSLVFSSADRAGVQLRAVGPQTLTLEEIFLDAFKEGGK